MKTQTKSNSELRSLIAFRILELRKTSQGALNLHRGFEPVPLGHVTAASSLKTILSAAIQGYSAVQYERTGDSRYVEVPDFVCEAIESDLDSFSFNLGPVLDAAETLGLDLGAISLKHMGHPNADGPYEDATISIFYEAPAGDVAYAQQIHELWKVHKVRGLRTEEDRAMYALYLELRERFE